MTEAERLAQILSDSGLHTAAELRAAGIGPMTVSRACQRETIIQYARGIYMAADAEFVAGLPLAALTLLSPGVVCLGTAAQFHELGDEDPPEIWYAVDRHRTRKGEIAGLRQPQKLIHWTGNQMTAGVEPVDIAGVKVSMTTPARTVVDLLRYRSRLGEEVGPRAMLDYFRSHNGSISELWDLAEQLGCRDDLVPFLRTAEELVQGITPGGMTP